MTRLAAVTFRGVSGMRLPRMLDAGLYHRALWTFLNSAPPVAAGGVRDGPQAPKPRPVPSVSSVGHPVSPRRRRVLYYRHPSGRDGTTEGSRDVRTAFLAWPDLGRLLLAARLGGDLLRGG